MKKPTTEISARRGSRGRKREDASFPAPPSHAGLPDDYATILAEIKQRIQTARLRTVMAANSAMVTLYWDIGELILERQEREGWGAKVIDRLSADLSAAYPDAQIVKQLVSQLPWGHVIRLLQRIKDPDTRHWYVKASIEHGWSRNILEMQIDAHAHERHGKAITNFNATLPPAESDMAAQIFKDPYLFDFLGTADPRREREVEQALIDHISIFAGAGRGFCLCRAAGSS